MDLNYLLIWVVCFSCVVFLFRLLYSSPRANWGWIGVCSVILAITIGMFFLAPKLAGFIGATLWVVFVLVPSVGFLKVNKLTCQQRYYQARQLACKLCWLHPADGWLERPKILLALEMAQMGNLTEATQLLQKYSATAYHAQVLLYWLKADWQNCLTWFVQYVPPKVLSEDPLLITYYLRSLGETGDLNGLLQGGEKFENYLEKTGNVIQKNLVKMYVFAFCGQTAQVKQLFRGILADYSSNIQNFWIATSQMVAGKKDIARQQLLKLRLCDDLILSNAVEWRLCHTVAEPHGLLTQESRQILFRMKGTLHRELRYINKLNLQGKKAYLTIILIGINLIVFGVENILGGSESLETLYYLGALLPEDVWGEQWWRLITANFLHYGWTHLLTNMFGLYFLGRFVELSLGKKIYLITYLLSGIGAMFFFTLISIKQGNTGQILVGASAAIMGLIGLVLAMFLIDWYKNKSQVTTQRVQVILVMIGLQFVFDWTVPQVSFLSHLLGVIIGFLSGLIFLSKTILKPKI